MPNEDKSHVKATSGLNDQLGFTWMGKSIDDCDRNDLVAIIKHLLDVRNTFIDYQITEQNKKMDSLQAENKKLWSCLGSRSA